MNNIEIRINKKSKMVDLSKTFLGNEGESLQGKLIFSFDEFVEGQARLEFEIDGKTDMIFLERVGETYQAPILSKLTKKGQIDMQLVISEGISEDEIAIFKSNVFYIYCNYSINAESEQPEEYPSWIEIANTKLNQLDNINIGATKENDKTIITITRKDGSVQIVEVYDGTLDYNKLESKPSINGINLVGNKTLDELGIQAKGEPMEIIESDPSVPQHVKNITLEEIAEWNSGKNYKLPIATKASLGGIIVGENLEIDEAGFLNAKASNGTYNYEELMNVPTINGTKVFGNKTSEDYGIVSGVTSYNDLEDKPTIPTKTSELVNDNNLIVGSNIQNIVAISQADFDALAEKNATTIYVIVG